MPSPVFFADLRANYRQSFVNKIDALIKEVKMPERVGPKGLCALKIHFGELGNTAFIRPVYVRRFVEAAKKAGSSPFLTDCNTLYRGARSDSVSHLHTAIHNGFAYSVTGAPLIIADGLRGQTVEKIPLDLPECSEALIGSEIAQADSLVSLAHFKGHELTGFGGTLKNLGMGAAGRQGKLFQHSNVSPKVKADRCLACGDCIRRCPAKAIKLIKRKPDQPAPAEAVAPDLLAQADPEKCIGCGDCILTCPTLAMSIQWDAQVPQLMRRMVAYTQAVLKGKEGRSVFFNFLTQISPGCDCNPFQDAPVVADLGLAASTDPVALDQASIDLVNQAQGMPGSCLEHALEPGGDKFKAIYPNVDWRVQLAYAEEIGLGSRKYDLVTV